MTMKLTLVVVALVHAASCGYVRMPYLNPAGVTYVDGTAHAGLAAGPISYTTATARPFAAAPVAYSAPAYATHHTVATHGVSPVAYSAPAYAAPAVAYAKPLAYAAPAVAYGKPIAYQAPVAYAKPIAYQAPVVTKYAAVNTVQHVHGVADVPVTRYEAQHAVIQKSFDVAKPAIKTRKYEIRRPAIQKQFYDIEERIVVRPAGSALVELDQPLSKTQKGDAVISHAAYAIPAVKAYAAVPAVKAYSALPYAVPAVKTVAALPAYARLQPFARFGYTPFGVATAFPGHYQLTQAQLIGQQQQLQQLQQQQQQQQPQEQQQQQEEQQTEQPQTEQSTPEPQQPQQPQQPYPFEPVSTPAPQQPPQAEVQQDEVDDDDSVSVDNPEFAARSAAPEPSNQGPAEQESAPTDAQPTNAPAPQNSEAAQARSAPAAVSRSFGGFSSSFDLIPQARSGPYTVPSLRNLSPDMSQANQQRLIELLTARGNVAEVGVSRSGPSVSSVGEAGQVRARVLSATPAPPSSEPTGERVNTRRVVVSSPIETLQEIEVQEPVTKLERVHYQQPTFIKTARQELVRVPTSVPVYGKALTPVAHHVAAPVAHAAYSALPAGYSTYYG